MPRMAAAGEAAAKRERLGRNVVTLAGVSLLTDVASEMSYPLLPIFLTTVLGYLFAIPLPRWLGIPRIWGAAGLTMSAGLAGWVEMLMLRHTLNGRIGRTGLPTSA